MRKKITLAQIKIPLSQGSDDEATYRDFAYLNLICTKLKSGKIRSDLRINIKISEDVFIWKGSIKKLDLDKLHKCLLLTCDRFNNEGSNFKILSRKLHDFLLKKKKKKKEKGK